MATSDEDEARRALEEWKRDFPDGAPAYRHSGKMPPSALLAMLAGAVIAIPVGMLPGMVVAHIARGIVRVELSVGRTRYGLSEIANFFLRLAELVMDFGVVVIAFITTPMAIGMAAAACVSLLGRMGKNRNPLANDLISVAAAITVFWYFLQYWENATRGQYIFRFEFSFMFLAALAAAILAGFAAMIASKLIMETPFCEACETNMQETESTRLSRETSAELARRLSAGETLTEFEMDSKSAGRREPIRGVLKLFFCPVCRGGFADLRIVAASTREDPTRGVGFQGEEWLTASRRLAADEVDRLRDIRSLGLFTTEERREHIERVLAETDSGATIEPSPKESIASSKAPSEPAQLRRRPVSVVVAVVIAVVVIASIVLIAKRGSVKERRAKFEKISQVIHEYLNRVDSFPTAQDLKELLSEAEPRPLSLECPRTKKPYQLTLSSSVDGYPLRLRDLTYGAGNVIIMQDQEALEDKRVVLFADGTVEIVPASHSPVWACLQHDGKFEEPGSCGQCGNRLMPLRNW